jgi:hypothetical protein
MLATKYSFHSLISVQKSGYDSIISHITKPENEPWVMGKYINRKLIIGRRSIR